MERKDRLAKIKEAMLYENGIALKPSRGMFYLTSMCNLHCKMCFQKHHKRDPEELSLNEIKEIFKNTSLSSILLVGGEIFTRPDIYEIIDFFNYNFNHVAIQTNSTLIDKKGIETLANMKNVKEIWISIDGLSETHNAIRGRKVFEHAIGVIKELNKYKRIFINTVILKDNIHQLQDIYNYFDELGVAQITFQFEMGYCPEQYDQTERILFDQGIKAVLDEPNRQSPDFEYAVSLVNDIPLLIKNEKTAKVAFYPIIFMDKIYNYVYGNIRNECQVVCNDFVEPVLKVNAKGDIVLCEAFNLVIGNLKENGVEDIWNSESAKKIRQSLTKMNLTDMCSRCCCLSNRKVGQINV
jgi:radical SAM protein with 4Fe4S-binding SPASM domain